MKLPLVSALTLMVPARPHPLVRHTVAQLRDYLIAEAGVQTTLARECPANGVAALIGANAAKAALGERAIKRLGFDAALGAEGYVLATVAAGKRRLLVAAGPSPAGTRHAVLHLLRCCRPVTGGAVIVMPRQTRFAPAYPLRGMYAHQHWSYRHPYALRTWSVDEWQRYVDMLGLMRLNLFQIWSMASICPAPFSPADAAFLQRYPPVIEYAQRAHGMKVWIGECANNLARPGPWPPVPDRRYFDVEQLVDPGDPAQVAALREHRAAFYRICDNADGYWVIDSDPGGWKGSPSEQFVELVAMNRALIDRHTRKGRRAKLIYWMWESWGTESRERNCANTLELLKQRVKPPVWLTNSWAVHGKASRAAGMRARTVFYPYGAIEPEPSLPFTTVIPPALTDALDTAQSDGPFAGVMGNAQTPLVQLPNIWFFANAAWDPAYRQCSKADVAAELAALLYPDAADALAAGWLALDDPTAVDALYAARRLQALLVGRRLGAPGALGRLCFPAPDRIVEDLACLLEIHAAAQFFCRQAGNGRESNDAVADALAEYVRLSIQWRHRTGFKRFGYYGYDFEPVHAALHARHRDGPPRPLIERLARLIASQCHGETGDIELYLAPLCDRRDGKGPDRSLWQAPQR